MKQKIILSLILIIVAVGTVFTMTLTYEDEMIEQDFYCQQVNSGAWPDYKEIADKVCK
jgi:hypothetical protein